MNLLICASLLFKKQLKIQYCKQVFKIKWTKIHILNFEYFNEGNIYNSYIMLRMVARQLNLKFWREFGK